MHGENGAHAGGRTAEARAETDGPGLAAHQRLMSALYAPPADPMIHVDLKVDAGPLVHCLDVLRNEGRPASLTAVLLRVVSEMFPHFDQENVRYSRGRLRPLQERAVWLYTGNADGRVFGQRITNLEGRTVDDFEKLLATRIRGRASQARLRLDRFYRLVGAMPVPLLRAVVRFFGYLNRTFRIPLRFAGIPADGPGAVGLTNVGSLGFEGAPNVPIPPFMGHSVMVSYGRIHQAPVVRRGEVVAADVLPIHVTLDHRIWVGTSAVRLANMFVELLTSPSELARIAGLDASANVVLHRTLSVSGGGP